ncbi:MAG: VOC family protein [Candidatus Moraniibacteriota bacterium]|nr:MAG: VOC family protein [Candidatus Moranbacteria bacterium]
MAEEKGNAVGWFEIPVVDMERAMKFYETVLEVTLSRNQVGEIDMAWFQMTDGKGAAGSLVFHKEWYKPSAEGVLVYFTAYSGDLSNELSRVEMAGGKILAPKKAIGEYGFMALVLDTEGNRIALHSKI